MGVIRKKQPTRPNEGGLKFICDVCSKDVTSTVRIRCDVCNEFDLCVPCFKDGLSSRDHKPAEHAFLVIEQHSVPIYDEDWGADEELSLIEGAERYGLGSWAETADHIGGYRTKDECREHYINTYVDSPNFPLPLHADPADRTLADEQPSHVFHARKKRRIEARKEQAKSAPPATPKQKPTASVPACHEVAGYMPGRLEFETEFANEAEEAVQHMQFEPGEGLNPLTGEMEPELELKMVVMDIYNSRLTARADRKKVIFEHNLLEYKKNTNFEKKKTKEEKTLLDKVKPFARMMNHSDFSNYAQNINEELNLRQAISQLQDWRNSQISTLKEGERYEQDKLARLAKPPATGLLDRQSGIRTEKKTEQKSVPDLCIEMTAPELPERLKPMPPSPAAHQVNGTRGPLTNGNANAMPTPNVLGKAKYSVLPLPNVSRVDLKSENATDLHLLTKEEGELCSVLGIMPKPYLVMKEGVLKEAMKNGGGIKRKGVKELCKVSLYSLPFHLGLNLHVGPEANR